MRLLFQTLFVVFWASAISAQVDETKGHATPIPDGIWQKMLGVSWHDDLPCPPRHDLTLLHVPFRNFDGAREVGQLIVDADLADEVLDIFSDLMLADFRIQSMKLVSEFGGDDTNSMDANNTSAFNCRRVAGTSRMSNHAFGRAMDINPVQNPFVTKRKTSPRAGIDYDDPQERTKDVIGIVLRNGPVVMTFKKHGWDWGGNWLSLKDYQHFSKDGG